MEPPTMPDAECQLHHSSWPQLYQSVTDNSHAFYGVRFQNHDHAVHEVVPQGSFGGCVQNTDARAANPDFAQSSGTFEHAHYKTAGESGVDIQRQDCDVVPSTTRSEPRTTTRKRSRDKNWTEDETSVLVQCKALAFHDRESAFRKQKSSATNWEAISAELRKSADTRASEKTGDQCRLRWDTLVKSHRIIKELCEKTKKGYGELTEDEISDLKLPTALKEEWYEVIDSISRNAKPRKRDNPPSRVGSFAIQEGRIENVPPSCITPADAVSPPLFFQRPPSASTRKSPPSSLPALVSPGRPEPEKIFEKQIAIQKFSSLDCHLRSTLLDLIWGSRYLHGLYWCQWLSIVQNRSCSDLHADVILLAEKKLVRLEEDYGSMSKPRLCGFDESRFYPFDESQLRVFDKFVKKVIRHNPNYDTHRHLKLLDEKRFVSAQEFSTPERIRVLMLDRCQLLERVDFRGLRKLRSLCISDCDKLQEVTGWKFLRELGWLEIRYCGNYHDFPDLQNLPSLKVFRHDRSSLNIFDCRLRHGLAWTQCVRLRRLEICCDDVLEASGDLSSLKCLESLSFSGCTSLLTIAGFSGLHSLTFLNLDRCLCLSSLPDIGHMKELEWINVCETGLEEIPGIEKLVSLKMLYCSGSDLKHLPDLHHLPHLQQVWLDETPLIEDDPSSFYFDKPKVLFNCEETVRLVDVSGISDTEYNLSDLSDDEDFM